jgi:hypothetical protein
MRSVMATYTVQYNKHPPSPPRSGRNWAGCKEDLPRGVERYKWMQAGSEDEKGRRTKELGESQVP